MLHLPFWRAILMIDYGALRMLVVHWPAEKRTRLMDLGSRTFESKILNLEMFCVLCKILSKIKLLNNKVADGKNAITVHKIVKCNHSFKWRGDQEIQKRNSPVSLCISVTEVIYRVNIYPMLLKTIYRRCKFPEGILAMAKKSSQWWFGRAEFFSHIRYAVARLVWR